jgi:AAHS family benzoate transporter-like MFS transporter
MAACALAPSPELLGLFRFLAGLGLGGVIPSAVALTVEYAPAGRKQFYNAAMFLGYSVGGVLAAVCAIALVADQGWRVMFWIGALPLVTVLPLAYAFLPESAGFLLGRGRTAEAQRLADRYGLDLDAVRAEQAVAGAHTGPRGLFEPGYRAATLLFGATCFCGLLVVYGMITWLPKIMIQAGYELGSALTFLLVLNLGAIVGALVASRLADRVGSKPVCVGMYLAATASLLVLSVKLPTAVLLVAVAVAGAGIGTQILLNGYIAVYYPTRTRGAALGWSLGVGRIGAIVGPLLGGFVIASGLGFQWNFYGFAVPALIGAVLVSLVPRTGG